MKDIRDLDRVYKNIIGNDAYYNKNVTNKSIVRDFSKRFDKLQVCFMSDMHIGSSDFDIKGLIENLRYAESQENAVVFFLGDSMNTAIVGSKSDSYEDVMHPQSELEIFSAVLSRLKASGKVIVVHSGNHEDRITRAVGVSTTKMAADIAGVGEAFAPFFASTTLILRQPGATNGQFPVKIITHHGTGIHNTDGVFKLIRNVANVDIAVIGHIHNYSNTTERTIKVDENGNQYYQKVLEITLPASGGGTYGAGMALPDVAKQSAVWLEVCSQRNPFSGLVSPTGVNHREFIPSVAFFTPTNTCSTDIEAKRNRQAKSVLKGLEETELKDEIDAIIDGIVENENKMFDAISKRVTEKALRKPNGFDDFINSKTKNVNKKEPENATSNESESENEGEEVEDEMEM